jgi:hypothetical protein
MGRHVVIDSEYVGPLSYDRHTCLEFRDNGGINVPEGTTVKIEGPIRAEPWPIFRGPGRVDLSKCPNREIYLEWFGGMPEDRTVDCSQALIRLQQAIMPNGSRHPNGLDAQGRVVPLSPLEYFFQDDALVWLPLQLLGATRSRYNITTRLTWIGADVGAGFCFLSHLEARQAGLGGGGAHGFHGEGLGIVYGAGGSMGRPIHGIQNGCVINLEDCYVANWPGNGVSTRGNTATVSGLNTSLSRYTQVHSRENGMNGFYTVGGDASLILFDGCDATNNRLWGYKDQGYLGNTYLRPHASLNGCIHDPQHPLYDPAETRRKHYGDFCIGLGDDDTRLNARPALALLLAPYAEGNRPTQGPSRFNGTVQSIQPNYSSGVHPEYPGQIMGSNGWRQTINPLIIPGMQEVLQGLCVQRPRNWTGDGFCTIGYDGRKQWSPQQQAQALATVQEEVRAAAEAFQQLQEAQEDITVRVDDQLREYMVTIQEMMRRQIWDIPTQPPTTQPVYLSDAERSYGGVDDVS